MFDFQTLQMSLRSKAALLFLIALLLLPAATLAQEAVLLKDINQNGRALVPNSGCGSGLERFLFIDDGIRGYELWFGDGLAGSTYLVKDIREGIESGLGESVCAELNGIAYFGANDGVHGYELWRSDGTSAGTYMVKDVNPGSGNGIGGDLNFLGSSLIFSGYTAAAGYELWKSDGTEGGTVLLKDIEPGASDSSPETLIKLSESQLIFAANTAATGRELYSTNGTSAGTTLIKDIYSGVSSSNPGSFKNLGDKVLFVATTAAEGRELWSSDGTTGGTSLVMDILPGASSGTELYNSAVLGDQLIFTGITGSEGEEPWATDGTTVGTALLRDIYVGGSGSYPSSLKVFDGKVYFTARSATSGVELWRTEGTTVSTIQYSEIAAGDLDGVDYYSKLLVAPDGSKLIFAGSNIGEGGHQLYSSNGTPMQASRLLDLLPGFQNAYVYLSDFENSLGFPAAAPQPVDSIPPTTTLVTDGTANGTTVHPGTLLGYTANSTPILFGTVNGKAVFAADDGDHGYELWTTDSSSTGTVRITDINEGLPWSVRPEYGAAVVNNLLFFVASTADTGSELWVTDGTSGGTHIVKDIVSGKTSSITGNPDSKHFYALPGAGLVVFAARTPAEGIEPWISDGTSVGTTLLKDIRPGFQSSLSDSGFPAGVTQSGNTLFFAADDGTNGTELWRTNGLTAGTVLEENINAGSNGSFPASFTTVPSLPEAVVFTASTAAHGGELWFQNGSSTSEILDINSGAGGSNPQDLTFLTSPSARVLFSANDGTHGRELWVSTGTGVGTNLVKDIVVGASSSDIGEIAAASTSEVIFSACSLASGEDCEPWKSDGTSIGTVLIKDIATASSSDSSFPSRFQVLNPGGEVYFAGVTSEDDYTPRIFKTDLSEAGTTELGVPGTQYFSVNYLPYFFYPYTPSGGTPTLLFPFYSSSQGFELFKIGTDECPSDSEKTSGGLCGCGVIDADNDGDGAVDCLEECPDDRGKSSAGTCGCGTADVDENGNGIFDCTDQQLPSVVPDKPKLNTKGAKVKVTLQERAGIVYVVEKRIFKAGGKKKKWKSKTYTTNIFKLRKPPAGYVLQVRYRYQVVGDESIQSALSKKAGKIF